MSERSSLFSDFLTDVRMRASDDLTSYIVRTSPVDEDGEKPDPADVHEDVRESLAVYFEEIRERVEGPRCPVVVPIGPNTGAACRLLAGHTGECEPCVGTRMA